MAKPFREERFHIRKNEEVYSGQHSEIESITLSVGKHSVDLLRKKFRGYDIEFMDGPKWHTSLKEHGYPVIPTWRYDAENKVDYLTDLRRGGTHRVIDFCGGQENYETVHISNMEELKADVEGLLNKSADDGLFINEPNIFFDVEISTGVAKILLGDLRELGYDLDLDQTPSRDQIYANNDRILKGHMSRLAEIAK